jgi:hypothetical protein
MKQLVRFEGEDGSFMWVEAEVPVESDVGLVVDAEDENKALTRLEDSMKSLRGAATALLSTIGGMAERPNEVTLELGLSFAVEGGVIVAKGSATAEASVSLMWRALETEAPVG